MSMICQHALNESEAEENQQVKITSSIRAVSIFQALRQSPFLHSRAFCPLESYMVFKFSIFHNGLHLLKDKE